MKKASFFSQLGQRLNSKTSSAPVFLFLLYYILAKMSNNDHHGLMDIFGWLAIFCLFSSLSLFAVQLSLGLYHVLTGKGSNQNKKVDLNLSNKSHEKTFLLPLVMIAIGLLFFTIALFRDVPSDQLSWLDKILVLTTLFVLPLGLIWLVWNFLFGVYFIIRGSINRRSEKDD